MNKSAENAIPSNEIEHPHILEQVGLVGIAQKNIMDVEVNVNKGPTSPNTSLLSDKSTPTNLSPSTDEKPQVYIIRKSAIFKKRLTFGTCTNDHQLKEVGPGLRGEESTQSCKNISQTTPEVDTDDKRKSLEEYNAKLKAESKEWSSLRKLRKQTFRKVSKLPPQLLKMENIADILTEEDKAFLAEAPDYERIANDLKSLMEESVICERIEEKAKIQTMTLLNKFEEELDCITSEIINYSFVTPM